ncbi:hypothetical protein SSTU70S_00733 [Stutzerimonas stutzeri]
MWCSVLRLVRGLPLLLRRFLIEVPTVRKPLLLCRFTAMVFYDIVVANLHVAKLVLGPKSRLAPAFVEVPMAIAGVPSCSRY